MIRILPASVDLLLVLVFAVVGRATHAEGITAGGVLGTALPFWVACLVGWVVLGLLDDAGFGARGALVSCLVTLLGGVALRITLGDTAAWPFVAVAALVLAALFAGWRVGYRLLRGRRKPAA